jgi:hypothetical protein
MTEITIKDLIDLLDMEIIFIQSQIVKQEQQILETDTKAAETGMVPSSKMPIAFHILTGKLIMIEKIKKEWLGLNRGTNESTKI